MDMKRCNSVSAMALLAAVMTASGIAHSADKYLTIVLDGSGSMALTNESTGNTRWDDALRAARSWVVDFASSSFDFGEAVGVGIWTFKSGDGQEGLAQIWPPSSAAGTPQCPTGFSPEEAGDYDYCVTRDDLVFAAVTGGADSATGNLTSGVLMDIRDGIIEGGGLPDARWKTPLADSLCDLQIELEQALPGEAWILLESDGNQNVSLGACGTFESTISPEDWVFATDTTAGEEWGYDLGSWQTMVLRKLYRFTDTDLESALASPLPDTEWRVLGEFQQYLSGLGYKVHWAVDVHYQYNPPLPMAALALAAPSTMASGNLTDVGLSSLGQSLQASLLGAPSVSANLPGMSISLADLAMFRSLGNATTKSSFREFVASSDLVYGVDRALAGDVDQSGCSDIADYHILMQSDIWLAHAVLPNELATRADLSRDGWVDAADLDILLDNWGLGCVNSAGDPPYAASCFDGIQNGSETALDCGSLCAPCYSGDACGDETDCISGVCSAGVCAVEACDDGVQNGDELDVDCGGAICGPCSVSLDAEVVITNDWGSGFCASLKVTNFESLPTTDWSVTLDTSGTALTNTWSAVFSGLSGNITVAPVAWNAVIAAGSTIGSVGFCARRSGGGNGVPIVVSSDASY